VQSEDVDLAIAIDGAQLDARDDAHAELPAGVSGFGDPRHRVVIGEGDRRQAGCPSRHDDGARRPRSVRRRGMRVKIDKGAGGPVRPGRDSAHFA
jgi:hypothetical protein